MVWWYDIVKGAVNDMISDKDIIHDTADNSNSKSGKLCMIVHNVNGS